MTPDKCVVCPAHGTAFDLKTGEVKGEWCPKVSRRQPATLSATAISAASSSSAAPSRLARHHRQPAPSLLAHALPQFPNLPLVGKLNTAKPLPTYESRVDEAGNIEVLV